MKSEKVKFIYWQDGNFFIGYLGDYPDYLTQGESFEELKENLNDLYKDLSSGEIPFIRKIGELQVA